MQITLLLYSRILTYYNLNKKMNLTCHFECSMTTWARPNWCKYLNTQYSLTKDAEKIPQHLTGNTHETHHVFPLNVFDRIALYIKTFTSNVFRKKILNSAYLLVKKITNKTLSYLHLINKRHGHKNFRIVFNFTCLAFHNTSERSIQLLVNLHELFAILELLIRHIFPFMK